MDKNRNIAVAIVGIVLVLIGIFSLFGQYFAFWNINYLWPLIVVGVGAAFLIVMLIGDRNLSGFAIPGSILTTIGLFLLVMNLTNTWEAWLYYWALIVCAAGFGVWLKGVRSDQPELKKHGLDTLRVGLYLFILFGVIVEFIFYLTGMAHRGSLLPWSILLSLVGVYLLVTRLLRIAKPGSRRIDLFWPVIMVGVGLVGIFSQLNWMTADNLGRLANLWPLLLIVVGIGLIFRHRSPWVGAALGVLLIAGVFVVAIAGAQLGMKLGPDWISKTGLFRFSDEIVYEVSGSGNLITETRLLDSVNRVELTISADLEIQQGARESITITADDNIFGVLQTEVSDGTLTIGYKPWVNLRNVQQPKLVLRVKSLHGLMATSSGKITVDSLTTGDFNLSLNSSCIMNVQNIQADKITAKISSTGYIKIQGIASSLEVDITSSGSFVAGGLQVQEANVTLASSGNATLWVVKTLVANLSSSGSVYYYGHPTINQHTSSSGHLIFKGER